MMIEMFSNFGLAMLAGVLCIWVVWCCCSTASCTR